MIAKNLVEKARLDGTIVSSSYTIFELLKWPTTKKVLNQLKNNFLNLDVMQIVDLDLNIAEKAARLSKRYNLSSGDALHISTALESKCNIFVTNDKAIKKIKDIKILKL